MPLYDSPADIDEPRRDEPDYALIADDLSEWATEHGYIMRAGEWPEVGAL